ncbi:ABC transporter permease [Flavivirga sp. 57AJ16]|uniref:ABC transporter permease n=1 Tax=Flavivirga sp. 57AJ16 TaxID=3025307 RepID=UPI002367347D|nr:ABC transporter permease [Flavivirga sp. 57AJ16]MDD7888056.1 ABC transporter permease [Flavivirga sp. 57AJ16]
MLRNYFKITLRVFLKNRLFTAINVLGLAIGITAYMLITQYVNFESNYDNYHPQVDNLYRVTYNHTYGRKDFVGVAANHPAVGPALKQDFTEVESFARLVERPIVMRRAFVLSYTRNNGTRIKSNVNDDKVYFADNAFLNMFRVNLLKGDPDVALKEPNSIIISEEVAKRFFGNEDPINKNLIANNNMPIKILGVFEKLPDNTHLKFDILVSFSTLSPNTDTTWVWPEFYNYVRLKPGTDPKVLESKFPSFTNKYLSEIMEEYNFKTKFELQPVKDIHLKSHLRNEIEANASEGTLNFLRIIGLFVILIALINFINLSTAKSVERAMEVGLKKVVGISKKALIGQFLFESVIINFLATLIAILLVSLLIKPFNQLVGLNILSMDMWLDYHIWIQLIGLVLLGGILAGAYPAFILSGFKPIQVLKGKFHQSGQGVLMRKILVVAQFSISIALIAGTFIVNSQFSFMQDQELGYDVEHNLIVNAPTIIDTTITHKMMAFKNELLRNPKINSIATTDEIPGRKITKYNTARQLHIRKGEGVRCSQLSINHDFLETYKIKLLTGRNFRLADKSLYDYNGSQEKGKGKIMINKAASKKIGFLTIEEALGKQIIVDRDGKEHRVEIIGVMDDYHQESLRNDFDPIVFFYFDFFASSYLTINLNTSDIQSTIAIIENKFESFFPLDPFNYFFLEEHFNKQYQADLKFSKICNLFAILAIFIATLGLFGLGSYMAMRRTKELCVRKVLGASKPHVLFLIPKSLLVLVFVSGLIAIPVTHFIASEWLTNYAFRVSMNLWMFIAPLLLVTVVALISVLPESLRVTLVKPANYLRNE